MMSLMYSVATHAGNSVLNYNLDYNSQAIAIQDVFYKTLVRFYTETCWVHCNTKSLTYQGRSKQFIPADLAGRV